MSGPHHRATDGRAANGTATLFVEVLSAVTRLLRGEIALARAEAEQRIRGIAMALVQLVVAVVLGITAMNALAGAGVAGLIALGLSPAVAALIIGALLLLLAYGFVRWGLHLLSPAHLKPTRSFANIGRDLAALKSMVKPDDTA